MTEDYICPKEGCDYGEDESKSLTAVRSHINAAKEHDWGELKPDLYAQAENNSDVDGEGEEGGEPENTENDSESDKDEMPTQEEYREQYEEQTGVEQAEDGGESGDSETRGVALPISPTMVVALLGTAVVLFVAYRALSGDDDGGDVDTETVEATTEDADEDDEVTRGLVN